MPLVRISLHQGKSSEYRRHLADAVHQAMVETINVPLLDRFQVITEYAPADLIYDSTYLDIKRTDDVVFVQITLNTGRTTDQKRALYQRIVDLAAASTGIRPEDILINLVETTKENWSFGGGKAQYAT